MDWITYWTLISQALIAIAILTLPLGASLIFLVSAVRRGATDASTKKVI